MTIFSNIKISENVFIASVPFFGYVGGFFYEVGRFYALKVPLDYIQISIELILKSSVITFSVLTAAISFYFIVDKFFYYEPSTKSKQVKYILNGTPVTKNNFTFFLSLTFLFPTLSAFFLFSSKTLSISYIAIIAMGLLILLASLFFLPPLAKYPDEKSYLVKFNKYADENYKKRIELAKIEMKKKGENTFSILALFGVKEEDLLYSYIKLTIYLVIWSISAFILGSGSMRNGTYSITQIDNNDYVFLGTYSGIFILVGVNKEQKVTNSDILLMSSDSNLKISRENIGIINEIILK